MTQEEKVKKVLFVNKFGPTSNAITGQTAKELADYLHASGCEVSFLCIGAIYRANQKKFEARVDYKVKFIRDYYSGDSSVLRLLMSFVDGFRLFVQSMRMKSDVIIIMTEPPLLFFWFQLFRGWIKRKVVYWTMDVYPDAFAAGKFITPKNIFYKFFRKIVYRRPPDLLIALGDEQRKYLEGNFKTPVTHAVVPCGVVERTHPPLSSDSDRIVFAYGGNIGAAHDPQFLVELIRQLDPSRHKIILSLYGTKAASVKEAVNGNPAIEYREFLNHNDIASFDINVASLLPEWNHISVPSKAVTAVCCGSALLFNAPKSADGWHMFSDACWLIEPSTDYREGVKQFLRQLNREEVMMKRMRAREIAAECVKGKQAAYRDILHFIHTA